MNKRLIVIVFTIFFGIFLSSAIAAQDAPPLKFTKNITNRMLVSLKRHKKQLRSRTVIHRIVKTNILPHIEKNIMARSVIGSYYWRQASSQTKIQFKKLFVNHVIDMYASALSSYSNQVIKFRPMRRYSSGSSRVLIHSVIHQVGGPPISLNYRLIRRQGGWKIYDFSVDNVSMVQSYKAQFSDILRRGGLSRLVNELRSRG